MSLIKPDWILFFWPGQLGPLRLSNIVLSSIEYYRKKRFWKLIESRVSILVRVTYFIDIR